jgi:hypothetical protein
LESKSVKELREICRDKGIDTVTCADKRDLVDLIISSFSNRALVTASNACAGAADRTTGAKLFKAANDGDAGEVITLLSTPGVQRFINYQNSAGRTPLSVAVLGGYSTVTKELIKARCDIDLQGEDGGTPLHAAAQEGNVCITEQLIAARSNVNLETKSGCTPLYIAVCGWCLCECVCVREKTLFVCVCVREKTLFVCCLCLCLCEKAKTKKKNNKMRDE